MRLGVGWERADGRTPEPLDLTGFVEVRCGSWSFCVSFKDTKVGTCEEFGIVELYCGGATQAFVRSLKLNGEV